MPESAFEVAAARWRTIADLHAAAAVLEWDQLVCMPAAGAGARADQLATLAGLAHAHLVAPELAEALAAARPGDETQAAWLRVARREQQRAIRVPAALVEEASRAASAGYFAWVRAREEHSFGPFAPALARLLDLARQRADALGHGGQRYDALVEDHEPAMTTARLQSLFSELEATLVPLVAAIAERPRPSRAVFRRPLAEDLQWAVGRAAVASFGYDWSRGRQDRSVHPFSTAFSPDDARITTRLDGADFAVGFFATVHEAGHAMYEQGLPAAFSRGPLGQACSTGVHESQSRLWENAIARSLPFWEYFRPVAASILPDPFASVGPQEIYRASNVVEPSPCRVEADEVTYNLHVALRFELELALLRGDLPVTDLPGAWNDAMVRRLGLRPENDLEGVLQDVHWSGGSFGYFPSYTLGNVLSSAWLEAATRALGPLEPQIRRGEFAPLLGYLRREIHSRGAVLTPDELVLAVTGQPLSAGPYLASITAKYSALYGL